MLAIFHARAGPVELRLSWHAQCYNFWCVVMGLLIYCRARILQRQAITVSQCLCAIVSVGQGHGVLRCMVGVCADAVHAGRLGAVADCRVGQEPTHPRPKPRCLLPKPPRALHTGALIYSASLEWNIYLFSSLKFLRKIWRLDQAAFR